MSTDYCDRSSELFKCAQLFQHKVISGRAKLKPCVSRDNHCYRVSESSIFRVKFFPLVRHIASDLGISQAKMKEISVIHEDPSYRNQKLNESPQIVSDLAEKIQSEVMNINQVLKQALKLTPSVLKELENHPQLTKHVNAINSTLQYRLAELSMNLRTYFQEKKNFLGTSSDHVERLHDCKSEPILLPNQHPSLSRSLANALPYTQPLSKTSNWIKPTYSVSFTIGMPTITDSLESQNFTIPQSTICSASSYDLLIDEQSKRHRDANDAAYPMDQVQMTLKPQPSSVIRQRESALRSTEQTIVQLGEIYQQFHFLVKEQADLVTRIDANVDDSCLNVEMAHNHLVEFFRKVSSRRSFMLKLFATLIVCFCVFAIIIR